MARAGSDERPRRFRLGIVGHGMWPAAYLLPGARALSDVVVVAVCGRDDARAAAFADAHGIPRSYDEIERMLRAEDLDGVIIANPPRRHESAVRAVAGFRAAVLCEKPLALEGGGARCIRDLLQDRPAMTGFTLRWQPLFRTLRGAIREGLAGRMQHVRIRYVQSSAATPARDWGWRFDAEEEPLGVVSDLGPHAIDLVRWMVGEVRTVTAFARTTIPERLDADGRLRRVTSIDDADVLLEAESGVTASLTISRVAPAIEGAGSITIEVLADEGWMRIDSAAADVAVGTASGILRIPAPATSFTDGAATQIRDFVDVARGQVRADAPTVEDGYRAQLVMDAVAQSLERGEAVAVGR